MYIYILHKYLYIPISTYSYYINTKYLHIKKFPLTSSINLFFLLLEMHGRLKQTKAYHTRFFTLSEKERRTNL